MYNEESLDLGLHTFEKWVSPKLRIQGVTVGLGQHQEEANYSNQSLCYPVMDIVSPSSQPLRFDAYINSPDCNIPTCVFRNIFDYGVESSSQG